VFAELGVHSLEISRLGTFKLTRMTTCGCGLKGVARVSFTQMDTNMSELSSVSRSNLRQGAVFMLVGLVWGMVIPATAFPRFALTAHIQLTANGVMFLVAGLVILRRPTDRPGVRGIASL
jgi:hypothetical protein